MLSLVRSHKLMLFSLGLLCNIFAVSAVATPTDMTAVIQATTHGPLALSSHIPTPIPNATAEEVLIRVHYSALNRMDLLQAKGKYPLPPGTSDILGVEVSELFRPTLSLSQSLTHSHTHAYYRSPCLSFFCICLSVSVSGSRCGRISSSFLPLTHRRLSHGAAAGWGVCRVLCLQCPHR